MIPFNKPPIVGTESDYMCKAIASGNLCGGGRYTKACEKWLEKCFAAKKALLTPSCTAALEMAAILLNIRAGDEVIMPSYTFVSTANAFALRGARIVFVDIRPDTMNIDETKIEAAVTEKTKVIVPVHYGGVACEMDTIMSIAQKYRLFVVEDAAQGVMASYKGKALGSIGHLGCYSFHETKNYSSGGEGGAILINDASLIERAEIIREKGTDRSRFFRGQIDKYTWRELGSSYLMSELQAAYLYAQLEQAEKINRKRLSLWRHYFQAFHPFSGNRLELPHSSTEHNAHMFYLKFADAAERNDFISSMQAKGIMALFHYIPLHSSPAGAIWGKFIGSDRYTTVESERLVRLPLYYNMTDHESATVIDKVNEYLKRKSSSI